MRIRGLHPRNGIDKNRPRPPSMSVTFESMEEKPAPMTTEAPFTRKGNWPPPREKARRSTTSGWREATEASLPVWWKTILQNTGSVSNGGLYRRCATRW